MNRRTVEAYYNVDGNYWCTADGSYATPLQLPHMGVYEQILFKLHLVRHYGIEVTDFGVDQSFRFSVYSDAGILLVDSRNEKINSAEALDAWPTVGTVMGADETKGRFAILVDAASVPLREALTNYACKWLPFEFVVFDLAGVVATVKDRMYFTASRLSGEEIQDGMIESALTQGTQEILANSDSTLILADTTKYNLLAPSIEAPEGAAINYGVTTVLVGEDGFTVFYNATVIESGYVLRYTLIRKG